MPLFKERKRIAGVEQAEQAGKSFWTAEFDDRTRVKIWHCFVDASGIFLDVAQDRATRMILRDEGIPALADSRGRQVQLGPYLLDSMSVMVPTIIEAMFGSVILLSNQNMNVNRSTLRPDHFRSGINEILLAERISFELIGVELIEKESQELHSTVVAPVLRLLSGRTGWEKVENAYQGALREIHDGHPDDAITDAAAALQESLIFLGCDGNALGPLIDSAKKRGLLASHDQTLGSAIAKILDWVSADRSEMGDGHKGASKANRDDAWLTVHVVGAVILRLAGGTRKS